MKTIQIANNQDLVAKVDDEDFERLSQFRWLVYSSTGYEYAVAQIEGKKTYMHRFLCGRPGLVVDHINGDTLDNRRCNLRAVSTRENTRNQHVEARSNAGIRNVHYSARIDRYTAKVNGIYLGCFKTAREAEQAAEVFRLSNGSLQDVISVAVKLQKENALLKEQQSAQQKECN